MPNNSYVMSHGHIRHFRLYFEHFPVNNKNNNYQWAQDCCHKFEDSKMVLILQVLANPHQLVQVPGLHRHRNPHSPTNPKVFGGA